jgi:cell division protein FtsA
MIKGKNLISILDIGSTKITCFIVKKNFSQNHEVLGAAQIASKGVRAGMIIDLAAAKECIIKVVESAEAIACETIKKIYVSLNSSFLISERDSADLILSNQEINVKDLNKILFKTLEKYNKQDVEIIHTLPYEYILDGNCGIVHPLGLYGNKLTGFFHIICAPSNYIVNIAKCLEMCQLGIEGYVSSGYAAGVSCLKNDELEFGSALIEIGGGSTTVSVFFNDSIIFTDGIPYGGIHITRDIAKVLNLDTSTAEKIKNIYGSTLESSEVIDQRIRIDDDIQQDTDAPISKSDLNAIIRARAYEIINLLKDKLDDNEMLEIVNKIVVTGGCSQLFGIKELVEENFRIKTRVAIPIKQDGVPQEYIRASFSVPIGMLKCISNVSDYNKKNLLEDRPSILRSTWGWLKENF